MASVLDLVKHYQKSIEKYPDDEQKILKSINKLFDLDVKVHHLQDTGVGRTVNSLRKEPGKVGQAARALVYKWKCMVAAEESDQEGDYANNTTTHNGNERASFDTGEKSENSYKYEPEQPASKQSTDDYSQMNGSYSGSKRQHDPEPDITETKKSRNASSDRHSNKVKSDVKNKSKLKRDHQSSSDKSSESDDSDSEYSESDHDDSPQKEVTIKKEKPEAETKDESHKHHSTSPSSKSSHHTKSSKERHSSESKHSKTSKDKSQSSEKHKSSKDKVSSSEKEKSFDEKENSEKKHKSSKSSEKDKRKHESDSKRHSSDEKHKSSSSKNSSETNLEKTKGTEKIKSSSDKHSNKSEKHSISSHSSKNDKHKNLEKENSQSESEKSSKHDKISSKDKHSSSSKDKAHKSSSKDKTSDSHKSEKNSTTESKSKSSEKEKKSSSSKSKEEVPKKKQKTTKSEVHDDGIDCGSGASFAEALGMINPAKPKKKPAIKSTLSPNANYYTNDLSPAAMLAPTAKLAPLPAIEISALPEISPNYRPLPPPKLLPHFNDEEAMSQVLSSKNQRTKVYSGNKVWGKVPSLYEMCVNVLQEHIDALEYTGGVPYEILKPVVDKATPQQLYMLEHFNPYLMEDTDHLWQKFCEKSFRNKKREELETWREMYMRCQEEQDSKLKSLAANIKSAQEAKRAPIKQTKMAYVDTVVKPPRNIARKQAQHGTAFASSASPAARVASLATAPNVLRQGLIRAPHAPSASLASLNKPKKAPLMQKALQFMRGRKR